MSTSYAQDRNKRGEKLYAFSVDGIKRTLNSEQHLNFSNISKGFYDELLNYDDSIKKSFYKLQNKKENGIKELVYTNKRVPESWRNKISYYSDLYKTMTRDNKFVSYLGKINSIDRNDKYQNKYSEFNTRYGQNNHIMNYSDSLLNSTERSDDNHRLSSLRHSPNQRVSMYISMKGHSDKSISDKEILNILEEYKTSYPIEIPKGIVLGGESEKDPAKSFDKTISFQNTLDNSTKSKKTGLFGKTGMTKSFVFKSTIYNNLIPENGKIPSVEGEMKKSKKKLYQIVENKLPFLNSNENFYDVIPIKNQKIDQKLKDIDYYGPHFSHCSSCRNKNTDFYNNMEHGQCLQLLGFLKKYRRKNEIKIGGES